MQECYRMAKPETKIMILERDGGTYVDQQYKKNHFQQELF